jgi:medium-chain acyl-[acyl-carrier-protein] hydrolase
MRWLLKSTWSFKHGFFVKKDDLVIKEHLFFFPHAGGAGESYQAWMQQFDKNISCQYAQLPGRGRRFLEPAIDDLDTMTNMLMDELLFFADKPISFFGHSMGALIAFELASKLFFEKNIKIKNLFLSAHRAPSLPLLRPPLHQCSPEQLFTKLQEMGGFTDGGFELTFEDLQLFYPTLYGDLKLCELYQYTEQPPLPINMSIMWGDDDPHIEKDKMDLWQKESTEEVQFYPFQGDHFYHRAHQNRMTQIIHNNLKEQL